VTAKVISGAKGDTVVHASMKEMTSSAPCSCTAQVRSRRRSAVWVVKSTGGVYGTSPQDQAVFTEGEEPNGIPASGYAKDAAEVEGYVRGFVRRRSDVAVTVLCFASIIGAHIDRVLSRYFSLRVVPTVLGYDSRVQLWHEEDALAVLERATRVSLPGIFNVGGAGVLLLSQAIRRVGRISVPVPELVVGTVGWLLRGAALVDYSAEQIRFLNVGRVLDTRLRTEFAFSPGGRPSRPLMTLFMAERCGLPSVRDGWRRAEVPARARRSAAVVHGGEGAASACDPAAPTGRKAPAGEPFAAPQAVGPAELAAHDRHAPSACRRRRPGGRQPLRDTAVGCADDRSGGARGTCGWPASTDARDRAAFPNPDARFAGSQVRPDAGVCARCRAVAASGELVGVWPEGFKGLGERYRDRYKLRRFGHGGSFPWRCVPRHP
jgi:UDP-glucose 4-epimerase